MSETQDWRARRWEDTHQRIYDTAMRLFQEQGFEQVSVGQIASGAEVSVPTFYAHYQSKEHLVMQLPTPQEMNALCEPARRTCRWASASAGRFRSGSPRWTPEYREANWPAGG